MHFKINMFQNILRTISVNSPVEEIVYFNGDEWLEMDWTWQAEISVPLEFRDVVGNSSSVCRNLKHILTSKFFSFIFDWEINCCGLPHKMHADSYIFN
jgi:hypothetical protein